MNVLRSWCTRPNSVLRIHCLSVCWKELPWASLRVLFMPCRQSWGLLLQPPWLRGRVPCRTGPAVFQRMDIHEVCYNKLIKPCSLVFDFCNVEIQNRGIIPLSYTSALPFAHQIPADKTVCLLYCYIVLTQRLEYDRIHVSPLGNLYGCF